MEHVLGLILRVILIETSQIGRQRHTEQLTRLHIKINHRNLARNINISEIPYCYYYLQVLKFSDFAVFSAFNLHVAATKDFFKSVTIP